MSERFNFGISFSYWFFATVLLIVCALAKSMMELPDVLLYASIIWAAVGYFWGTIAGFMKAGIRPEL